MWEADCSRFFWARVEETQSDARLHRCDDTCQYLSAEFQGVWSGQGGSCTHQCGWFAIHLWGRDEGADRRNGMDRTARESEGRKHEGRGVRQRRQPVESIRTFQHLRSRREYWRVYLVSFNPTFVCSIQAIGDCPAKSDQLRRDRYLQQHIGDDPKDGSMYQLPFVPELSDESHDVPHAWGISRNDDCGRQSAEESWPEDRLHHLFRSLSCMASYTEPDCVLDEPHRAKFPYEGYRKSRGARQRERPHPLWRR